MQEVHFDQIENEVNQFRNMVDVHLELDDAERKWDDFYDEVVKDVDDLDIGAKVASSLKKLDTYIRPGGDLSKLIVQLQAEVLVCLVMIQNLQKALSLIIVIN